LPIGFSPGKYFFASASLMTIEPPESLGWSLTSNSRPSRSLIPIVAKYSGVTTRK